MAWGEEPKGILSGPQFANWFALRGDGSGPSGEIGNSDGGAVDSQVLINGGQKIVWAHLSLGDEFTAFVCGTNDLATADAPAGKKHGTCMVPVIAAWLDHAGGGTGNPATAAGDLGDFWRAAELACHHYKDAFIEAALVDIVDEGADGLIEKRRSVFESVENMVIDGVIVPVGDAAAKGAVESGCDNLHT